MSINITTPDRKKITSISIWTWENGQRQVDWAQDFYHFGDDSIPFDHDLQAYILPDAKGIERAIYAAHDLENESKDAVEVFVTTKDRRN